ncbi:hypothetical protein PsYK624_051860 [Phanerochaete sordida]|uniref:Uncharacterized protein n=1 Tax=Phanerochaete sordida TaxID=48140 RepID=A0A9P3LC15_9APHY|nr:hypothetical protein PsYK624_051860 [Phanerochaete sordida]
MKSTPCLAADAEFRKWICPQLKPGKFEVFRHRSYSCLRKRLASTVAEFSAVAQEDLDHGAMTANATFLMAYCWCCISRRSHAGRVRTWTSPRPVL